MSSMDWVSKIVVLQTDGGCDYLPQLSHPKVRHISEDFGKGLDKQPEDGGFNEVAARNRLTQAAKESGCRWLLTCDADEFFMPGTEVALGEAEASDKLAVWFSCYHFRNPRQHLWLPGMVRDVRPLGIKMHDPHLRAMRLDQQWFWVMNDRVRQTGYGNRTAHCYPSAVPWRQAVGVNELLHIHTRQMFDPKRLQAEILDKLDHREADLTMPAAIVNAWSEQESP